MLIISNVMFFGVMSFPLSLTNNVIRAVLLAHLRRVAGLVEGLRRAKELREGFIQERNVFVLVVEEVFD